MEKEPYDNSGQRPLRVPGFLNYTVDSHRDRTDGFCCRYEWTQLPRVTAREIAMLDVMSKITDKPHWEDAIFNDAMVTSWRLEALSVSPSLTSEMSWDWCVAELRDKATIYRETGHLLILDVGACVYKSDKIVSESIRDQLKAATPALMAQYREDWDGEDGPQTLHLVDPSLYLLDYGKTCVLAGGEGCISLDKTFEFYGKGYFNSANTRQQHHSTHQWLPSEVELVGKDSASYSSDVRVASYINNLHPLRHKELYQTIEKLIALAIEPWNRVLLKLIEDPCEYPEDSSSAESWNGRVPMRIRTFGAEYEPKFPCALFEQLPVLSSTAPDIPAWSDNPVTDSIYEWLANDKQHKILAAIEQYLQTPENDSATPAPVPDGWRHNLARSIIEKANRICRLQHPEPGTAFSYEDWKHGRTSEAIVPQPEPKAGRYLPDGNHIFYTVKLQDRLKEDGLQVVVRVSSIELQPGEPFVPKPFTSDGTDNDCLVATAVYCYDLENIAEVSISYQQTTDMDRSWYPYDDDEYGVLVDLFGLDNVEPASFTAGFDFPFPIRAPINQSLGTTTLRDGRLLAWSCAIEHQIASCKLADATRPGLCRYITLHLVDPTIRLCSTRNVPPQQHDWYAEQVAETVHFPLLPELQNAVSSMLEDWPLSLEKAKELKHKRDEELTARDKRNEDHPAMISLEYT